MKHGFEESQLRLPQGHMAPDAFRAPGRFFQGDLIADRYRIERFIDRGGMGDVYAANDLELGVTVALKTIRPDIANDPQALLRFKREVLMARSISHPNVCRIYDLGRHRTGRSDATFLSMEFLEGEDLSRYLRRRGPLEPHEAVRLFHQMTSALEAAHEAGIVHRDFKSSNVMVVSSSEGPKAVVTDFGLAAPAAPPPPSSQRRDVHTIDGEPSSTVPHEARHSSDADGRSHDLAEATGSVLTLAVGTPAYMSPEQVLGRSSTYASDLYSLGIVFYESLTGRLPFRGANSHETAHIRLTQPPPPLGPGVHVDAKIEKLVLRLLEREPADRPRTAREVRRMLLGEAPALDVRACSIPAERDEFVDRTAELSELRELLESKDHRLVSVVGPGGVGKTRLSRRYGWQSLERWPGGVWFCDLTEARSLDGIASALATALGVQLGKDEPIALIGRVLANRERALVILDNFEQVCAFGDSSVGRLLELAPHVRFLVTSRERLQLAGELVVHLDPLDPASEGVRLFESRAVQHRPGFRVDKANEEVVAEIVGSLDGFPLAIEMAASRLQTLSLNQLHARLQDRWGVLSGRRRGRHASMRKTLDWSWDLLGSWERVALIQAATFHGGFDLEAAESIFRVGSGKIGEPEPQTIDVIQSLVDKSWLRSYVERGTPRFRMLASIQDYVLLRATETMSAERDEAECRHWRYFARFGAEETLAILGRREGIQMRHALRMEIDNIVCACRRAGRGSDAEACRALYQVCCDLLTTFGPVDSVARLGRQILQESVLGPHGEAEVHAGIGRALSISGTLDSAKTHWEHALDLARRCGDPTIEATALGHLASIVERLGDVDQGRTMHQQALALHRERGNRQLEAVALSSLGGLQIRTGNARQAVELINDAVAIHRDVGNFRGESVDMVNLAWAHHELGEFDQAESHYAQALSMLEELEDRRTAATVHNNLGNLYKTKGRSGPARLSYSRARDICAETGDRVGLGLAVLNLAILDQEESDSDAARSGLVKARDIFRDVGHRRFEGLVMRVLGTLHSDCGEFDSAEECLQGALEVLREVEDRVSEGHVLGALGRLHHRRGDIPTARRYAEDALALHRDCGDRAEEGVRLGDLADYDRDQGKFDEARQKYGQAEELLRELECTYQHAVLLCERGLCETLTGDTAAGDKALGTAERLASTLDTNLRASVMRRIKEVRDRQH